MFEQQYICYCYCMLLSFWSSCYEEIKRWNKQIFFWGAVQILVLPYILKMIEEVNHALRCFCKRVFPSHWKRIWHCWIRHTYIYGRSLNSVMHAQGSNISRRSSQAAACLKRPWPNSLNSSYQPRVNSTRLDRSTIWQHKVAIYVHDFTFVHHHLSCLLRYENTAMSRNTNSAAWMISPVVVSPVSN